MYKINFQNSHNFIFKEQSTLIKLNSQALYEHERKRVRIFKNIKIFTNFKNNLENKFAFNNQKNRIENSLYTSFFSRFQPIFQKSFIRLSLKNRISDPVRLFLGNIYADNVYLLKSKVCVGRKPKINFKYIVSVDEQKNSSIQLKTRNLDYFKANYKVDLNNSINLSLGSDLVFGKKLNNRFELNYFYTKDFTLSVCSSFNFKLGKERKIKNKVCFGFSFSGFKFWIPFYLSKFDNKSSLVELMFVNIMTNIAGYFTNFLYKRIFSENEFE